MTIFCELCNLKCVIKQNYSCINKLSQKVYLSKEQKRFYSLLIKFNFQKFNEVSNIMSEKLKTQIDT